MNARGGPIGSPGRARSGRGWTAVTEGAMPPEMRQRRTWELIWIRRTYVAPQRRPSGLVNRLRPGGSSAPARLCRITERGWDRQPKRAGDRSIGGHVMPSRVPPMAFSPPLSRSQLSGQPGVVGLEADERLALPVCPCGPATNLRGRSTRAAMRFVRRRPRPPAASIRRRRAAPRRPPHWRPVASPASMSTHRRPPQCRDSPVLRRGRQWDR